MGRTRSGRSGSGGQPGPKTSIAAGISPSRPPGGGTGCATGWERGRFAHPARQPTQPRTPARKASARLRQLGGVIAAITCGLLASAIVVPAAFAMVIPAGQADGTSVTPGPATTGRVITAGGMAGWQITMIALGAALFAAVAAVLLDRALTARPTASTTAT